MEDCMKWNEEDLFILTNNIIKNMEKAWLIEEPVKSHIETYKHIIHNLLETIEEKELNN